MLDKIIVDYKELKNDIEIETETFDSVVIDFKELKDNIIIEI